MLFFTASDGTGTNGNGRELWVTDGTEIGTEMVLDINIGTSSSGPSQLAAVGDILYFQANDNYRGSEVWRSDGTSDGTFVVKDVNFGPHDSNPYNFVGAGGILYYLTNYEFGTEIWSNNYIETTTIIT